MQREDSDIFIWSRLVWDFLIENLVATTARNLQLTATLCH